MRIAMRGIVKRFDAATALENVDLDVRAGEVHALLGENGAGKSTLMRVLAGEARPDAGVVRLRDQPVALRSPADAAAHGIAMVHQHFTLVENFTVAENLALVPRSARRWRGTAEASLRATDRLGWRFDMNAQVWQLPVGVRQWLEITKAVSRRPETLILDEPTSVLTPGETDELFRIVRDMAAAGVSIIFITHKLAEVMALAGRVTVLRHGRRVATLDRGECSVDLLARLMIGESSDGGLRIAACGVGGTKDEGRNTGDERGIPPSSSSIPDAELRTPNPEPRSPSSAPLVDARDLSITGDRGEMAVRGVSFTIRDGEILGIAGVDGNGQSELAEAMAGLRPVSSGTLRVIGKPPWLAPGRIAFVPPDRARSGIVAGLSVGDNLALGLQAHREFRAGPFLRRGRIRRAVAETIARYDIRVTSARQSAGTLSGGNQQKLIVARALYFGPRLLIVANPTRGLDVGAAALIHDLVRARRQRGGIALFSTDLDEVTALADRVAIMSGGRIVGVVPPDTSRAALGLLMGDAASGLDR